MSVRVWFKLGDRGKTSIFLSSDSVVDDIIEKALEKVKEHSVDPTSVVAFSLQSDGQRTEFDCDTNVRDLGEIGTNPMMPLLLEIDSAVEKKLRLNPMVQYDEQIIPSISLPSIIDSTMAVRSIRSHRSVLKILLCHCLPSLAVQLYSQRIITDDMYGKIYNENLSIDERVHHLLGFVEAKISANPSDFIEFIHILDAEPSCRPQAQELVKQYTYYLGRPKSYDEMTEFLFGVIKSKPVSCTPLVDSDVKKDGKIYSFNFLESSADADVKIFVRESYLKLYGLLTSEKFTLINGNPGFGKSYFGLYVIYRLMQEKSYSIIYVNRVKGYSAFICGDRVEVMSDTDCRLLLNRGSKENRWYIHDCATRMGKPDMFIASMCARTLVLSSPAKSNYADFQKEGKSCGISFFYMPPWSLLECQAWNTVVGEKTGNYEERFWHWGGNAREVFGKSYNITDLDQAIRDIEDPQAVISKLKDVAAGRGNIYSHRVLHLFPNDSYDCIEVKFASPYVSREVYQRLKKKSLDGVLQLIRDCSGEPTLAGIMGPLFEQFAHEKFSGPGEYSVKNLKSGKVSKLLVDPVGSLNFKELSEVVDSNVYYFPVSKGFKSVDSILPKDEAFQMTVSNKHPVQYNGLTVVKDQLQCGVLKLYFVVPKENFDKFPLQNYLTEKKEKCVVQDKKDIEQFVLSMDITHSDTLI